MSDDITLTVRVRDMTRGDFDRLRGNMNRMKQSLQGINRATASAGQHSRQLGQDVDRLSTRLQRMQQTGRMTRRELVDVRGTLDAMGRSAIQAARSGEITQTKFHSLNEEINRMRAEFDHLGQGLGRTNNQLRRTNNTINTTIRSVNGLARSVRTTTTTINGNTRHINTFTRDLNTLGNQASTTSRHSRFLGGSFMMMRQKAIGAAVVLGATLLPTIGALAPMIAGVGAVAGVAALAFMGLDKPTKFLSKTEKQFLKDLKPVTKEFQNLQKRAREAILPELAKYFDDIKDAVKGLEPVIDTAGESFSRLVGKIAKGVNSKDFKKAFAENVEMGTKWFEDFSASFGTFLTEFFEFGTKSKPALDAWQQLLGGFLDTGLPNTFKELERGIGGSSTYLKDFADFINTSLLPVLGKVAGGFMKAFGPLLGQLIRLSGNWLKLFGGIFLTAMEALAPIANTVADGFKALNLVFEIGLKSAGNLAKVLGGLLLEALGAITGQDFTDLQGGFKGFSTWVKENESSIRGVFTSIGLAIIDMVTSGVQALPLLARGLQLMVKGALSSIDLLISGLAFAFGSVPGMEWTKDADKAFDDFAKGALEDLDAVVEGTDKLAREVTEKSRKAKLAFETAQAKDDLDSVIKKLKDPELTKTRRAKLTADAGELALKIARGDASLSRLGKKISKPKIDAEPSGFWGKIRAAAGVRIPKKTATVVANTGSFWSSVNSLINRTLGTSYVNVKYVRPGLSDALRRDMEGSANGNIFKFFADGGMENHVAQISSGTTRVWSEPETGGEAYIPLAPTKRSRSRSIAEQTVGMLGGSVQWFAKGGVTKREKEARKEAAGELTISVGGKLAGRKNTEFANALGSPSSIGDLVASINKWRSIIKKATHGGVERGLLASLTKASKSLIKYQTQHDKITKTLEKAKAVRDSVKSGVLSDTNITRDISGDRALTVGSIMRKMTQGRDKAAAFANAIGDLRKKGVSKDIIKQIADAGIEGGGLETASALLRASGSDIASLNEMQKQINKSAKKAGNATADAMFGAGMKAGEGLIAGLEKQQKALEKAMMRIAKSMEKALKKALKIKSPSKVMEEVGDYTAEGFAVGIQKNTGKDAAWASMFAPKQVSAASGLASSGGARGGQVIFPIYIGQTKIDEVIYDSNRRTVRTHGGNVQSTYGRKNG